MFEGQNLTKLLNEEVLELIRFHFLVIGIGHLCLVVIQSVESNPGLGSHSLVTRQIRWN